MSGKETADLIGALEGMHVLIVDDSEPNRFMLEKLLRKWGMNPETVGSGEAALATLEDHGERIHVVLLDIQVPGLDGLAVAKQIRSADRLWKDIPLLAFTGNVFDDQLAQYADAGMNGYVAKPVDVEALQFELIKAMQASH